MLYTERLYLKCEDFEVKQATALKILDSIPACEVLAAKAYLGELMRDVVLIDAPKLWNEHGCDSTTSSGVSAVMEPPRSEHYDRVKSSGGQMNADEDVEDLPQVLENQSQPQTQQPSPRQQSQPQPQLVQHQLQPHPQQPSILLRILKRLRSLSRCRSANDWICSGSFSRMLKCRRKR